MEKIGRYIKKNNKEVSLEQIARKPVFVSQENVLTSKESDQLFSAFDQIGSIIIVRIPDSLLSKKKITS